MKLSIRKGKWVFNFNNYILPCDVNKSAKGYTLSFDYNNKHFVMEAPTLDPVVDSLKNIFLN